MARTMPAWMQAAAQRKFHRAWPVKFRLSVPQVTQPLQALLAYGCGMPPGGGSGTESYAGKSRRGWLMARNGVPVTEYYGVSVTDYCETDELRKLEARCITNLCEVNAKQRQLYLKWFRIVRHLKIKFRLQERQIRKALADD